MAAEDVDEDNWDRISNLNLRGVFFCAQAEGRVMLKAGYGKIINTASISGSIVNTPQKQVVYNTTKAGVMHMTRSLAAEWAPQGIRVNSISPGYTRTKLVDDLISNSNRSRYDAPVDVPYPPGQNAGSHRSARRCCVSGCRSLRFHDGARSDH